MSLKVMDVVIDKTIASTDGVEVPCSKRVIIIIMIIIIIIIIILFHICSA